MSLTSLARRASLPMSATQRLVADLLVHRFLERTQDGLLTLGPLIRESGASVPAETYVDLRNAAVPLMESVHAVLQQQVLLAVLNNGETLYLERVARDSTATNISQREARLPPAAHPFWPCPARPSTPLPTGRSFSRWRTEGAINFGPYSPKPAPMGMSPIRDSSQKERSRFRFRFWASSMAFRPP